MRSTSMISTLALVIYLGWVLLAGSPEERINRSCYPVIIVGNVVTSVITMVNESYAYRAADKILDIHYGCRYMAWRLMYAEDDYLRPDKNKVIHSNQK